MIENDNKRFIDGRICAPDKKHSFLISNKEPERLYRNIEDGVKEVVKKFKDNGYDLLSSCHGHPKILECGSLCDNNNKYVKIRVEKNNISKVTKNIDDINIESKLTVKYIIGKEDSYEGEKELDRICVKEYKDPYNVYINFGEYTSDETEHNYKELLKMFDKYDW